MKIQTRKTLVTIVIALVLALSTVFNGMAFTLVGDWRKITDVNGVEYYYYKSDSGFIVKNEWIYDDPDNTRYADPTGYMLKGNYSVDGYWLDDNGSYDKNVKRKEVATGSLNVLKTAGFYNYSSGTGYSVSIKVDYFAALQNNAIGVAALDVEFADGTDAHNWFYILPQNTNDGKSYGAYSLRKGDNFLEYDAVFYITVSDDRDTILLSSKGYTTPLKYVVK